MIWLHDWSTQMPAFSHRTPSFKEERSKCLNQHSNKRSVILNGLKAEDVHSFNHHKAWTSLTQSLPPFASSGRSGIFSQGMAAHMREPRYRGRSQITVHYWSASKRSNTGSLLASWRLLSFLCLRCEWHGSDGGTELRAQGSGLRSPRHNADHLCSSCASYFPVRERWDRVPTDNGKKKKKVTAWLVF